MQDFPNFPFLTKDFSLRGGGIDFLGMRWVNLLILADYLLPGINNQTSDFGTYCLGSWIPWKFRNLCGNMPDLFKLSNYKKYREFVEVGISYTMRDESPCNIEFGRPNNRLGIGQKVKFPGKLKFKDVKRTNATSIYAAPLYGPSLYYLDLLRGDAVSEDGRSTGIPLVSEDNQTQNIISWVDKELRKSKYYDFLDQIDIPEVEPSIIDDLGNHGLNPAFYRQSVRELKIAFIYKLLPDSQNPRGHRRTLTAKLLIHTLQEHGPLNLGEIYSIWHTGLLDNGKQYLIKNPLLENQRELWSIFQARQHQRFVMELFLLCFELAILDGVQSIDKIVDYSLKKWEESDQYPLPATFQEQLIMESEWLHKTQDLESISKAWNRYVHGSHAYYENIAINNDIHECIGAFKMLARWFLRTFSWFKLNKNQNLLNLGGRDRISMKWFSGWITARKELPIRTFLKDLFSELIFSQHVRIALSRFDGQAQRIRFILGDSGIVPTTSGRSDLGKNIPSWMADRLNCFVRLLIDLSIIHRDMNDRLSVGKNAQYVK